MGKRAFLFVALLVMHGALWAQGQDSTSAERDLQVIAELLEGSFDNTNQSYFDFRTGREQKHGRLHVDVSRIAAPEAGEHVFIASAYRNGDEADAAGDFLWALEADEDSVRMRSWSIAQTLRADDVIASLGDKPFCDLHWRREAAQFRATADACELAVPVALVLSDRQLWLTLGEGPANDYELHRTRAFECYADIPGVGGGRDIPYDRYEGFRIHDQGGSVWFDTKDNRRLNISLLLVDWPINNYEGVFSRDSLVIYVSEEIDGERKEHGYAFTVPEADRVGINLKWMLAFCYMTSNREATPYM